MKLRERLQTIQELQDAYELPWEIRRVLGPISIFGDQVCFGQQDLNDFVSISELKVAVEALAKELDGTVKWHKAPARPPKQEKA